LKKTFDAATNFSKKHQQTEEQVDLNNFGIEGVGNILAEMED
jgi:hypothetical protein